MLKLLVSLLTAGTVLPLLAANYRITERGADYAVWTPEAGSTNSAPAGSYVELETGMHYRENGEWLKSVPELEMVDGGAVARRLPYKASFGPTIASPVEVLTPDGKTLKFRVLGFAYHDFVAGTYVTFAEATNSVGILISSNQVLYPNAVQGGGLIADVRYTVRKSGIEQDFILRQGPGQALPEGFGFSPASTRLIALTECLSPPAGITTVQQMRRGANDKVDRIIDFGSMKIGHGAAFMLGADPQKAGLPVEKELREIDGRAVLLEQVEFKKLQPMLSKLQASAASSRNSRLALDAASTNLCLPVVRLVANAGPQARMLAASAPLSTAGVVLDFDLQSGTGVTLQGDTTYLVTGAVNLTNAVIEGGTVVKFTQGGSIHLYNAPVFKTKPWLPAVFTAVDDDSVGAVIENSTGAPSGRYAETAIALHLGGAIENVRILHAEEAVYCASSDYSVADSQILFCDRGLHTDSAGFTCYNVLMNEVLTNFFGQDFHGDVQHMTSHNADTFAWDPDFDSDLGLTNSVVVGLTNGYGLSSITSSHVDYYDTGDQVFVSAAGGHHYLKPDSLSRDSGTTGIASGLAAALKQKTTTAPLVFADTAITATTSLGIQAPRDTDIFDKGYHYFPLDYVFAGVDANADLTFQPGTSVGWYRTSSDWYHAGHGIHIDDNRILTFDGRAEALCYWVRCSTVQELDLTAGYGPGGITGWAADIATAPELRARFLRSSMLNYDLGCHIRDDNGHLIVRANDSEFARSGVGFYSSSYYLTNCLFERTYLAIEGGGTDTEWFMRSCTMIAERFWINRWYYPVPVSVRDSAFDDIAFENIDDYADDPSLSDYDYNAYLSGKPQLEYGGANNYTVASFGWEIGPLGNYYLPSNSSLINTGSVVNASSVGMYHYTSQTNQTKEATSRIDIGRLYIATGANGLPGDTDGDDFFDYLEDSNGNGSVDSGETDWNSATDMGLKVLITRPNGRLMP